MIKDTLRDQTVRAIQAGEITRALVARNLPNARLVYRSGDQEYEVDLPASCLILGVNDDPRQKPVCQELDLVDR